MRVGVFGGVFNPPHVGHLILAQEAHSQLALDRVLLIPVGHPSHRTIELDPGAERRLAMCELAAADDERLSVSRIEIDRPGPSYTVDTLRALHERSPGDELLLLIGGDEAAALPSWRDPDAIVSLARVAVAERDHWRRDEICDRLAGIAAAGAVAFFDMPRVEIASTLIRRRVGDRRPIRYLVPDQVASFIDANGLYRAPAAVAAP